MKAETKIRIPGALPAVFCDFDGTVTEIDATDQLLTQLAHPTWREIEQEWARGLIGSRECLERQIALVQASRHELDALIDSVPVDRDFARFYRLLRKRGVPLYLLSDGFDYVIRRVLKRIGLSKGIRDGKQVFASVLRIRGGRLQAEFPHSTPPCEHGCATCKPAILRRLGSCQAGPVIFIGDGLSDRLAIEEADVVFAKRNLLGYCRERGSACQPFETFAELGEAMEKILDAAGQPWKRQLAPVEF